MTDQGSRLGGAVISYTPSRMPEIVSFVLTAALFTSGFLLTFGAVLA